MISILVCRVGEAPVIETIAPDLASMQRIVGGSIECVPISPDVDLWINEEGRMNGSYFNRLVPDDEGTEWDIFGDFFLARHDEDGETIGLTPADIAEWKERIG
jgi:hypothetical protein